MLHAVEGVGGHTLFEDEIVLRQALLIEGLIERTVADHIASPKKGYHTLPIDYTLYIEYNGCILSRAVPKNSDVGVKT